MQVGSRIKFVGRDTELGYYHSDYVQLMGKVGTVIESQLGYVDVLFDDVKQVFMFDQKDHLNGTFLCYDSELEPVDSHISL